MADLLKIQEDSLSEPNDATRWWLYPAGDRARSATYVPPPDPPSSAIPRHLCDPTQSLRPLITSSGVAHSALAKGVRVALLELRPARRGERIGPAEAVPIIDVEGQRNHRARGPAAAELGKQEVRRRTARASLRGDQLEHHRAAGRRAGSARGALSGSGSGAATCRPRGADPFPIGGAEAWYSF
jgi:hypothetical protein